MEDGWNVNAGRSGDLIPEYQEESEMNKQDELFFRGWSKTGKRKEKSTRARVKIITGFFQEPGKQKLPAVKKRKISEESPRTGDDHRHSPSSGSRILEPGEFMENDIGTVGVTDHPGEDKTVALSEILTERVCKSSRSLQAISSGLKTNDIAENIIFTDGSASPRSSPKTGLVYQCKKIFSLEYSENQPRVALDFDLNELPPEWIPDE